MTQPGRGKSDLLAAARDAVAAEAEKQKAQAAESAEAARKAGRRPWLLPTCLTLLAVLGGILVVRPSLLIGGAEIPPDPPQVQSANIRGAMVVMSARLKTYRRTHGALPATLAELGDMGDTSIAYRRVDNERFILRAAGNDSVTFTSEDDAVEFLRGQLDILRTRSQ